MPEFRSGDVFANHRIEGLAGRGGMGVVYRATDLDLDRLVALKVIAPALAEEPDFRARFVAESKAAASIEHPHVIPVYYAGEREGVLFIVMRYVDGPDLRGLVRAEGRLEAERAAQIIAQVAGALDAAHAHGLVHRDVKPANVLLGEDDHAYLTDFGLTKREASTGPGLSRPGGWVGTLGFVAPEQIRGERVDARTDVYALGCVLVHALTGGAPYRADSDEATLWAHLNAPPPTDRVAPRFAAVVERALSKDPADRYLSAGDLGRAALAAAGRSGSPRPERNVARGAAAPEGALHDAAGARRVAAPWDGETHVSPAADGAGGGDGAGETAATVRRAGAGAVARFVSRPAVPIAALILVAGAVVALLLGGGGDGDGGERATTADTTTPASAERKDAEIGAPNLIATRPNGITITKGRIWVLSGADGQVIVVDAKSASTLSRIPIRAGGTAVAAGFGSVWALKGNTGSLIRISARTRQRIGAAIAISVPGQPISVATGENAVWVGVRRFGRRDGSGESLVRIDPSTPEQRAIPIPGGVQNLAVGGGYVWVTSLTGDSVLRVDVRNLERTQRIAVGNGPDGVAVGYGAVWVACSLDKSVTRINPKTLKTRTIDLGVAPTRVAIGGGSVWATAREANRLFRIDPVRRTVEERIDTGSGPYALDVSGADAVWLTLLDEGDGGLQRVRFYR